MKNLDRRRFIVALVLVLGILLSACDRNITAPSSNSTPTPDDQVQTAPGTTVLTATIPGTSDIFKWWITSLEPGVNGTYSSQGVPMAKLWFSCSATTLASLPGVLYIIAGTSGPDTPQSDIIAKGGYSSNGCHGGKSTNWLLFTIAVNGVPAQREWIRLTIWFRDLNEAGQIFPPGHQPPTVPPDATQDINVKWKAE